MKLRLLAVILLSSSMLFGCDQAKEMITDKIQEVKEGVAEHVTQQIDGVKEQVSATVSSGKVYTVEMKNNNAEGIMVFEPGFLKINKGDTVNFIVTDAGHAISEVTTGVAWNVDFFRW